MEADATTAVQLAMRTTLDDMRIRRRVASTWGLWVPVYHQNNTVGPVSQSGGFPTGAVIQRGSNANGEFTRWADGTQVCWRNNLGAANVSTAVGALFRSPVITWTFPAAFSGAPTVTGDVDAPDAWVATIAAPTASAATLRAVAAASIAGAAGVRAMAVGRWF